MRKMVLDATARNAAALTAVSAAGMPARLLLFRRQECRRSYCCFGGRNAAAPTAVSAAGMPPLLLLLIVMTGLPDFRTSGLLDFWTSHSFLTSGLPAFLTPPSSLPDVFHELVEDGIGGERARVAGEDELLAGAGEGDVELTVDEVARFLERVGGEE